MTTEIRVATFNASLNRSTEGGLIADLSTPNNAQAKNVAEIIQRSAPDVVLINEFDFDAAGADGTSLAAQLFQQNYLGVSQNGVAPVDYPYVYIAPSNTGIASGFDLNNNGVAVTTPGAPGYGDDALGFGAFPGQFGMVIFSKYPIDVDGVRTFQNFLWKDMPDARLPDDSSTAAAQDWYSPEELAVLRLSSKSHWDVPVNVNGEIVHILAAHPTPPVFDGPEDRNGLRNADEIRFWADYVQPGKGDYIYDDQGGTGGLAADARFVIVGDYNADPNDGDSVDAAIQQILTAGTVDNGVIPTSAGAVEQSALQGGTNATHTGNPAFDTADFADTAPGNLRVDYVLPSQNGLEPISGGVFWPLSTEATFPLVGTFNPSLPGGFPSSDHKLVFMDFEIRSLAENGVASGDVTQDSIVLWARSLTAGEVDFEVATDATFSNIVATITATSLGDVPVKVEVDGLAAGTHYYYRATGSAGDTLVGEFSTAHADGHHGLTFGVSGDWRGGLTPYAALSNADERGLDFFVQLGDTIYGDVPSPAFPGPQAETADDFRIKYAETLTERGGANFLADLRSSTAVFSVIDDHEVTNDFAGGAPATSDPRFDPAGADYINETGLYANGLEAFHDYQPLDERVWSGTGDDRVDGAPDLYRTQSFGSDGTVFVLDARSFRDEELENANLGDPADVGRFLAKSFDPSRTMLGDPQLERLKADLLEAQQQDVTWKFVMVPEPIQNLGVVGAADRFEGYAAERTELLKFIDDHDIDNVVFISADIHGTLVNNLTYQTSPGGAQIALDAFEISTGAVAYSPELGPTVVGLALAAELISPLQAAFYASLPVANDGDSIVNDKDDFLKALINGQLDQFGYDPLGLNDNLASADGLVDATLLQGDYVAAHSFGWTQFDIDPDTQVLTVTTYGIPSYTEAEALADPAAIAARTPVIVSKFEVHPDLNKEGGAGNDVIEGGKGDDELAGLGGDDRLVGKEGDDRLLGGDGDDKIIAGAGNDFIDGGKGRDTMDGGEGDDVFIATPPNSGHDRHEWHHDHSTRGDKYDGGEGVDTLDFSGSSRAVELDLTDGITQFGSDTIVNVENLIGGAKGDELAGNSKANELRGNGGDDELAGERGDDRLFGGDGRDEIDGGKGNDILVGGKGKDTLTGGDGIDWFVFNSIDEGRDMIRDFDTRGADMDRIVLAEAIFEGFTGDDGADLAAGGFLRARTVGGKTEIQVDADGGSNDWQTIAELSVRITTAELANQVIVHQDPIT